VMMVTNEVIVASVVFVLLCLVFAHLAGRKGGRRDQEEAYERFERPAWEARIAGVHRELEGVMEGAGKQHDKHAEAIVQERAKGLDVLLASDAKYQRMLEEASEELADANARIDFFWKYPLNVKLTKDGAPEVMARRDRQSREEFDRKLTGIIEMGLQDD